MSKLFVFIRHYTSTIIIIIVRSTLTPIIVNSTIPFFLSNLIHIFSKLTFTQMINYSWSEVGLTKGNSD